MEWVARLWLGLLALACIGCTNAALAPSQNKPEEQKTCRDRAQPKDVEHVLRARGDDVAGIAVDIPAAEVLGQHRRHGGDLCFSQVLAIALEHMLADDRHSESPAALLNDYGRELLQEEGTRLSLARSGAVAPHGERVSEAWLFVLTIPALSDHVFWIVVERHRTPEGGVTAYSYGVN